MDTVSRYEIEPDVYPDPYGIGIYGRHRAEVTPTTLRFGIEYGNGKKATTLDAFDWTERWEGRDNDDGPHLDEDGGGGGGGHWSYGFWVWPLPPSGPVTFACEWPAFGIDETLHRVEGERFRKAADRAKPLFDS